MFEENDVANDLYIVTSGRIAIANKSIDGRESMVALMERGDLFGEMPLFDGLGRSAEARALEPSGRRVHPLRTDPGALRSSGPSCCGTSSRCWPAACATWTRRSPTRCSSTSPGAPPSGCSSWPAKPTSSRCPITQEELAGMVGASRERVNKAIASFIRLGWIQQVDRRYIITNRKQLEIRAR